ncbi:hypothetical protein [Caldilinea sp.]|uniref:hypothetical protein n=1 Tax=Caldilinea sp. TaxID=2293560 RepID=UPI0021DDBAD0|nr:hypothetical protein [Caldilinea sp.]GIV73533.1 MAG: hypothetical protein KatS3mg049_2089 [Caldilinea sp.]
MLLRLKRGTTTIILSGDGGVILGCTYTPRTPDVDEQEVRTILRSGGEITAMARRNVTESASVVLAGPASAILNMVRQLEALLPVESVDRRGKSVYVEYRAEGTGDVYRSEVLAGRVEWPDRPLDPWLASGVAEVLVIWTRRYYWEDTTLRDVPLSNGNGSGVTTGLTIYNHNDGGAGHDNFVDIDGADVTGVIPAPARILLANTSGVDYSLRNIYIGHNVQSAPGTFNAILEGEASTAGGTTVADSGSSNGSYRSLTWSGPLNNIFGFQWPLGSTRLAQARGHYFRVLARLAGLSGTVFARLSLRYPADLPLTAIAESMAEIQLRSGALLQDLGVIQIPPFNLSQPVDLALVVILRSPGSGSLLLDFVQLTALDSWRHLYQLGYLTEATDTVVDDGIENVAYVQEADGDQVPIYASYGQPIHLWPGRDQRLTFLWDEANNMNITRTFAVQVQYRPRRLTV